MKIVLAVVLLVLLSACGRDPSSAVYINNLTGNELFLDIVVSKIEQSSNERFMHSDKPDRKISISYGHLNVPMLGNTSVDGDNCYITISDGYFQTINPGEDLKNVLLHEIGHCFGLQHNPKQTEIMYASYAISNLTPDSYNNYVNDLNNIRK